MELRDGTFGIGFQLGALYELTPMTRLGPFMSLPTVSR
jgi:hypothetical protein